MNITRPFLLTVLLVVFAHRPAFATENCDVNPAQCSIVERLSAINDVAGQVEFEVDAFNALLGDIGDPNLRVISSMVNRLGAKAGRIQTISEVALSNLDNPGNDVEAISFIVLMQAANDTANDLQTIEGEVKAMTNAKQRLRDLVNLVNKDVADQVTNDFGSIVIGASDLVDLIQCPECYH
jgi:hypothetical protein